MNEDSDKATSIEIVASIERRKLNWNIILLALIAATPPTIIAYGSYNEAQRARIQSTETHHAVNSRMTELLAITKKQAEDSATLAEKLAEKARKDEAKAAVADFVLPPKKGK